MAKVTITYRSYAFEDHDPVIDEIRTMIETEGVSYGEVRELSSVSVQTLYNWFSGKTKRPQHATSLAVIHALGYGYQLVRVSNYSIAKELNKARHAGKGRSKAHEKAIRNWEKENRISA